MSETTPTTNGHIILVAEEDTAERAQIEAYLQRLGYHFVPADPLEHIVGQAAALRPAVILLNSALTAVDALLICQQLRVQSATAEIPILFIIPLAQAAQRHKIFAYPLTDFILQPFAQPELAQRLEAQLPQVAAVSRRSGFGQMLAATGVGLWEWNIRQNEVKWSSLVHSILDIPKETFDGTFESYFALVHDDDKAVIATAIEQTLQDPSGHYQVEHRVILPDGRLRWVEGRALVFKDTNDVPVRMIGTLVDVTERKSAFENVKESRVILERRSKTLSLINEIVNVVYQSLTVPSIATHTLEVIMAHTGVHSAVFYVLDESGETLTLIQSVGLTPEFAQLGRTLSVAHSFTGRAIRARQLLISDKVGYDSDMVKEIQVVLAALEIKRVVSIPLIHDQSVLGAINVSFDDLTEIDEQDTAMLLAVGKTVGLALDNAYVLEKVELEVQERRRSEQALRESEGRYAAVLEQAQDGVLIAQEGIIQFVNRSYTEMVDYPAEALIGRPVADLIAPEYREMVDRHHKARAQGLAAPRMYEAQLICRGGQRLDVEISGGRIEYEGQPASLALIRDITERKKAQEALRLSDAKFSAAFHTSADMVSISDMDDGTFVVVNESAHSVVGYMPDELIGKSALELGLWPDPAERLRLVKLLQQAGVFHDEETQLRHKDGHLVAVSLSSSILVIDNTSYVLALIRDISDRKQAEETLRTNEAMLRRTQKLAKLGSWSWDLQTDVIKWSDLLREIFSLEQDQEITTAYFQQRIYPADWPEIQSKIREAFRSDVESFFVEHRILRSDNKVGYVWTQTYFNRDENGRVISAYGVTQDITERKRPELVQSILFEISKITTQFDTLEEILVLVREQLGQLLDTTNFYVALYDETNELYHFPFAADEGDSTPWPSEALPNSLTDYVRRTGIPMRIDTTAHENLIQTGAADMIGAISKVWIGTPLKTKRGVVGVMAVQNYVNENAYDEEDLRLLTYVGENIAWVIEAKQAELALRESETRYRALFEQSNDAILLYDMSGRVINANQRVLKLLEADADEVLTAPVGTYAVGDEKAASLDRWAEVLRNGYVSSHERLLRTQKGNLITVEIAAVLIHDVNDAPVYVLTVLRDVTERKRAEEIRRENEALLRRTQELAKLGSWTWDLQTDDVVWSDVLYDVFDVDAGIAVTYKHFRERVHPADWATIQEQTQTAFKAGVDSFAFEHRIIRRDGRIAYLWTQAFPTHDQNGRVTSLYGVTQDITQRKRPEQVQSILFEISKITTQVDSLAEILVLVREQLGQLLDTTNFYVALYDAENDLYEFPFAIDKDNQYLDIFRPMSSSLTDHVRLTGEAWLISETTYQEMLAEGKISQIGEISKVWAGVPLRTKRGIIGVMAVKNYKHEDAYTEEDLQLLAYVAENISWVIEAKQAEQALRYSETRYRALFEQSNDAILLYDMSGRVVNANQRAIDLLEGTAESVINSPVGRHSIKENKGEAHNRWKEVLERGSIPSHERPFVTQKGNLLTVEIAAVLIHDTQDKPIYVLTVLRDVTERQQAREALRKSEERLQLALDSANEGLWDWDLIRDDVYVSPRYYTLIGYEPGEYDIAAASWSALVHPDDLPQIGTAFSDAAKTQDRFRAEYRMRKKSGDYIWILDRGHVVARDDDGRPLRIVGTINDITAQKKIEIALRGSEQTAREFQTKLRYLHEISFELFRVENLDDLYRRAIELGREKLQFDRIGLFLLDQEKEQLLGTYGTDEYGQIRRETQYNRRIADDPRILEIYESGVRSRVWQNHPIYDKWMKIDTGWVGAAVLWNGSENIGYLFTDNLLNKRPLRPYEADLLMIYGSILGYLISRKFTEIEINHYVERLNVLQEIDDAILHAESPHKLARAIVQPLKKLVGCDFVRISVFDGETDTAVSLASTIQNLNALSLIHQFEPQVITLLEQGIPYVIEKIDADTSSSGERELQDLGMQGYIILPLRTEQDLHGMITIAFAQPQHLDSDQFKIVEEVAIQLSIALRQVKLFNQVQDYANNLERLVDERTAQLEAKAQELEAFTYSVSHDLRAPLRAMDGFARMLGQMYNDDLPEKAQHYVNRIQQNAKRMNALIDGLLTLSRIGRREMQMHTINLTTLAQDVLNNLTADDQLDNAAITIEPLGECMGDPALLRQLLVNLITNAIKYSHKKQSPQVTVRSMIQNGETVYLVKDNGVGFDMRYADKLFGVFQRLHSADEYEGTGVGLATVQRIVQRHNGRIWAEAAVNEGATFYFTLGSMGHDV